jgi:hypothetical protein
MRNTLHAHCYLNCFREIRDAEVDEIIRFLTVCIFSFMSSLSIIFIFLYKAHNINVTEELQQKPQATGLECPVEGCRKAPSATCENRFCEYDILFYIYLFKFGLKLGYVTNNFYVYLYGVIK